MDLGHIVSGTRHVMLDELTTLEDGDLGHALADMHAHHVAADGPALAGATPTLFEGLRIELDRLTRGHGLNRIRGLAPRTPDLGFLALLLTGLLALL